MFHKRLLPATLCTLGLVLSTATAPASETRSAVDPAVLEAQNRRVAVVEEVAPSVVAIFGAGGGGGGSGVIITPDGYALSNFHVTGAAGDFMKCGLNDGKLYDAVIVGIDPTGDVALLKLLGRDDFPTATMGDSDTVRVGDWAYAMGNPFLLATDFQPTVTYGIVSGVNRYQYPAGTILEYADCIQVDASINPGNSGGPLFNDEGELIGINGRGSFEKRGRVNSGAGYAISINQIKHFLGHLRSGRIVDHATLGATVGTAHNGRVVVDRILESSEAYRRGLRVGDEIVSFGGRPIGSVNQFKNVLGIYPKGWKVPLVYRQDNERREIMVRLTGVHRESDFRPKRPPMQPQPRPGGPERPRRGGEQPDGEQPEGERPRPMPNPFHARPPAPEKYKHMLVKKEGYANYYFNQLEQERILKGLKALGDFSNVAGRWRLAGRTEADEPFEFVLTDRAAALEIGRRGAAALGENRRSFLLSLEEDPDDDPAGSGGLLIAMHHLRLMLTQGTEAFTEFQYLGSEPLDGRGQKVDVLVSVLTGVETRWYVDEQTGRFVGFDTRLTEYADDCEVRFGELKEFSGRRLPEQFTVRSAGEEFATFHIGRAELAPGRPAKENNKQ